MAISITAMLAHSRLTREPATRCVPSAHDRQVAKNSSAQIGVALLLNSHATAYLTR